MDDPPGPAAARETSRAERSRWHAAALLWLPLLGFWLPGVGFFVSLALVLGLVPRAGRSVWGPGRAGRRGTALLGFAALWLPAVLNVTGASHDLLGNELAPGVGTTLWLLLPLCAPESLLAPTTIASAVYAIGVAASVGLHRPWPWVLGGLLSALSYDLTLSVLAVEFLC